MPSSEVVGVVLQFGFAGVLLTIVWLVNRQFIVLVDAMDRHLQRLTAMLEKCIEHKSNS